MNAVEAAIISMEDNPMFNAGKGSALNLLGEIESESGIMDGETLQGAGVALVKGIKNPIRIARIVMEKTNHMLSLETLRGSSRSPTVFPPQI